MNITTDRELFEVLEIPLQDSHRLTSQQCSIACSKLNRFFREVDTIEKIDLSRIFATIDQDNTNSLIEALGESKRLKGLYLIGFYNLNVVALATKILIKARHIEELHLNSHIWTFKNLHSLTDSLTNYPIKILNFRAIRFGNKGAEIISNFLKTRNSLKQLKIMACELNDLGANHISDALKDNPTLKALNISYNDITSSGINNILSRASSLQSLNIEANKYSPRDISKNLSYLIRNSEHLEDLGLEDLPQDNHFFQILESNSRLKSFRFISNPSSFFKVLNRCKTLARVSFNSTFPLETQWTETLKSNFILRHLSFCSRTDIRSFLPSFPNLQSLDLSKSVSMRNNPKINKKDICQFSKLQSLRLFAYNIDEDMVDFFSAELGRKEMLQSISYYDSSPMIFDRFLEKIQNFPLLEKIYFGTLHPLSDEQNRRIEELKERNKRHTITNETLKRKIYKNDTTLVCKGLSAENIQFLLKERLEDMSHVKKLIFIG